MVWPHHAFYAFDALIEINAKESPRGPELLLLWD